MQIASPRPPIPPVTTATRFAMVFSSLVAAPAAFAALADFTFDVASRRRFNRPGTPTSECRRHGDLCAALRREPLDPERPPADGLRLCACQPALGIRLEGVIQPEIAPVLRRRVDHP